MSLVAWIVLGLVAGFIGSKLVNKTGEGLILDIALGTTPFAGQSEVGAVRRSQAPVASI
jgi:uncharacterized membrane protein YeaQ/YmgE (transglycosylase-associated protein family)